MGRGRRRKQPVDVHLDRLEAKHSSGLDDQGRRWSVRPGAPGAKVRIQPQRRNKGTLLEVLEPPPDGVTPRCPVFGVCGGCQLQQLPVAAQLEHKADLLQRLLELGEHPGDEAVVFHGVRGTSPDGYGYRNKLELSFGTRRFDPVGKPENGGRGSFLGFHPPGWWSKIVPLDGCPLGSPAMQPVIAWVVGQQLEPAWDPMAHEGVWRHLILRDAGTPEAPRLLVALVTTSAAETAEVARVGAGIAAIDGVESVLHVVNDGVAEVARGELVAVLHGEPVLRLPLGPTTLTLPHDAFFQVNTAGAQILLQTIAEAAGLDVRRGSTLVDLYCGVGAIGLALSDRVERVVGVELHEGAIECARDNAAANGVVGTWQAGAVEALLPTLELGPEPLLVVDPPRAGLHPAAARFLAEELPPDARTLVYVACGPASLARDRAVLAEGGWRLTDVWGVDLFPQTHHLEAVARFVRG